MARNVRQPGRRMLALVTLLLASGAQVRAQDSFTLEQVLSAPFPTGLVAHPELPRVAWVQNAEGRRNVWVARGPDWRGRPVTDFDQDDGQELGDLQFTPDGEHLVFVRGGAPNRQGEVPNPTSDPRGQRRTIWLVPFDGGEAERMVGGAAPAVSPRGGNFAFLDGGQVWVAPLEGNAAAESLFEARGNQGSLRWSPDGTRIAFVSSRGDHSFVGVYDRRQRSIRWMDPSLDRDLSPVWSPDGSRLAFMRVPWEKEGLPFFPRREAHPWSIRVADPASGQGREIWRADGGVGSAFRSISAENQLLWGAGDRIVFPWEADGWTHLWSVAASGGDAALLTPGPFEVQFAGLTPDGREILYSSNQADVDRQHVWGVRVDGGPPRQLTAGVGIEWMPARPGGDEELVVHLASGPRYPAHAAVTAGGESRPLAPESLPADFPVDELVAPTPVIFPAADGLRIHGQLFLPPELDDGERRPAVVFFHGGSRRQMLLGWHLRGYYHNAYALNQYLASQGFVVLSVNYRSGIGYGMEFREALNYGASGGAEFNDVMGAGLYLAGRADVDPERIGAWGGSYGGYLTGMALSRASDLFAAGVDFHGVHDWNHGIHNFVTSYEEEDDPERARTALEASPMGAVDGWRSPVLLIHGDDDRNVNFAESVHLAEALRSRGIHVETLVFPDEVHGFLLHRSWLRAYAATVDFLKRHLQEG